MDWHACRPAYDGGFRLEKPEGKFCFHWCKKYAWYSSKKCKKWKLDIIDMRIDEDWKKIQAADMKLKK